MPVPRGAGSRSGSRFDSGSTHVDVPEKPEETSNGQSQGIAQG